MEERKGKERKQNKMKRKEGLNVQSHVNKTADRP